jgi:hypothetical protein
LSVRRFLPFVAAILLLSLALASLSRSQPSGNILVGSYWIIYLLDTLPILGLGALVLLTIIVAFFLRDLSNALGTGFARKLRKGKNIKHSRLRTLIVIASWVIAVLVLFFRCGGIPCQGTGTNLGGVDKIVSGGSPNIPLQGSIENLTNFVPWAWLYPVFLALLVVCSIAVGRSVIVGLRESRLRAELEIQSARKDTLEAVQDAIRIVANPDTPDPRMRIINCYQRLLITGSRLGADLTPHQTARELENTMRRTFYLEGPGISGLTALFEEARYSIHPIIDKDASTAREYLTNIMEEISPGPTLRDT